MVKDSILILNHEKLIIKFAPMNILNNKKKRKENHMDIKFLTLHEK